LVQLELSEARGKVTAEELEASGQNPILGLTAVLMACFSSGFAGVYFEKMLKGSTVSVWVRNIQLGFFGTIFATIYMLIYDGSEIAVDGFFKGYSTQVWFVVFNQAFAGLVVAAVIKYANNVLKGFAVAVSIILGSFISIFLFDFQPGIKFVMGASLVIGAVFLYSKYKTEAASKPTKPTIAALSKV
jgi:UDP-galactose transporter